MLNTKKIYSEKLILFRKNNSLSDEDVSRILCVSKKTYSDCEKGFSIDAEYYYLLLEFKIGDKKIARKRLMSIRTSAGLTVSSLASFIESSKDYINSVEKGRAFYTKKEFDRLCTVAGLRGFK